MLGDSITCFGWVLVGVVSKFSSAILAIKRLNIQSVAETFFAGKWSILNNSSSREREREEVGGDKE